MISPSVVKTIKAKLDSVKTIKTIKDKLDST